MKPSARICLHALVASCTLVAVETESRAEPTLTPPAEIKAKVEAARPLRGAPIPSDLKSRLGTTHYDGRYSRTDLPFLIEGADEMQRLGLGVAKFWLHEAGLPGYRYNSDWGIPLDRNLVNVLKHPYYKAALSHPFSTVILEVFPLVGDKSNFFTGESDFADEEKEFHAIASYLLKTYADRDISFILQNWEGDWVLRRKDWTTWHTVPPEEVDRRCKEFVKFLAARQRGVERARQEVSATKAKVYHAAEVNRVWDGMDGIATLTTRVLPQVTVDLVSWSCYDGLGSAVRLWQGIEIIRQSMRPSPTFGKNAVFIGEIGRPEAGLKERDVVEFWDECMGVVFAMQIPLVVQWELYCNEPKDGTKQLRHPRRADELKGFWWIRPDGSLSYGGNYLSTLLKFAGTKLPAETTEELLPCDATAATAPAKADPKKPRP